jgi:hypothetical protein
MIFPRVYRYRNTVKWKKALSVGMEPEKKRFRILGTFNLLLSCSSRKGSRKQLVLTTKGRW